MTHPHEEAAKLCLEKGLKSHWERIKPCGIFGEGVSIKTDYKEVLEAIVEALASAEKKGREEEKKKVCGSKYSYVCQVEYQQKEIDELKRIIGKMVHIDEVHAKYLEGWNQAIEESMKVALVLPYDGYSTHEGIINTIVSQLEKLKRN